VAVRRATWRSWCHLRDARTAITRSRGVHVLTDPASARASSARVLSSGTGHVDAEPETSGRRRPTPLPALTFQPARSGYLELMARARLVDSARVPIGLKVSEADAARIDEVLTRPEFAGWTRAEWCREIIRSALRYYVGDDSAPDPGQGRTSVPAAPQPAPPAPAAARSPASAASASSPAVPPGASQSVHTAPEPPAQNECHHPSEAWDYQRGTCAACGASVWD
jgi:hypothetical protein